MGMTWFGHQTCEKGVHYTIILFSLFKIVINKKEIIIQFIIPFSSQLILTQISLLSLINLLSRITTDLLITKCSILISVFCLSQALNMWYHCSSPSWNSFHPWLQKIIFFSFCPQSYSLWVSFPGSIYCSCWVTQILLILLPLFFSLDNLSYSINISIYQITGREGLGAGGEGDDRGWDGWMASLTR